jgi:hypothetical protein
MVANHSYDGRVTSYGALDLKEQDTSAPRVNGRAKALLVVALCAVSALAFIFGTNAGVSSNAVVAAVDSSVNAGDDTPKVAYDCYCDPKSPCVVPGSYVDHVTGKTVEVPFGKCTVNKAWKRGKKKQGYEGCMGIDYQMAALVGTDHVASCETASGGYDCSSFPCQNMGFCLDGVETYTCVCPWGFEGINCEMDTNECAAEVCDPNAECENTVGAYLCTCKAGFFGDGYANDQINAPHGSVLIGDYKHGWLTRDAAGKSDNNEDGKIDVFGCTDINDCASAPCFNGGRCIDLWDGAYQDERGPGAGVLMNVLDGVADAGYAYSVDPTSELFKAQGKPSEWECDCSIMLPAQRFEGDKCDEDIDECATGENNCDKPESTNCDNTEGSFTCTCGEFWQGDAYAPDSDPATWGCTVDQSEEPGKVSDGGCLYASIGYGGCTDINDCLVVTLLGVDADSDGAEDVLVESKCKNGGTCDNDNQGTGAYLCTCVDGWLDDQNCETDRDECEVWENLEQHCDANAHCHNIPGSWMCLCNNGWTGDGHVEGGCYDADDCEFSPCMHGGTCTDCGTLCLICDCIVGWRGKTCELDWNECKMGIHTCHDMAICINVPGSFECECEPGFSGDGYRLCNAVDDCTRWEDDISIDDATTTDYGEKRYDTAGRMIEEENLITPAPWADDIPIIVYESCDYKANEAARGVVRDQGGSAIDAAKAAQNSVKCVKSDEPLNVHQCGEWEGSTRTWIEHGACTDIGPASFECVCQPGWSDSNCDMDIDECARSTDMCHKYGTCINIPGSYFCECNFGYTGDGETTCHDVDDCSYGPERCYAGRCTDLGAGDFRCVCVTGYMDRLCDRDVNECADFTHTCTPEKYEDGEVTPGAICTNMPGSYKCMCRAGFAGDGIGVIGCDDIDECGSAPCENGECIDNGQLSYQCVCDYGWVNKHCDFDYNECYTGNHDCHPEGKCVNTPGGYYCRCVSGHTGDGYTCTDLDDCDPDPCDPEHGTCEDGGANKYICHCDPGFAGMGCEQDEVECMIGTHECHANADCFNTYGSYICVCKDEFYGDGVVCAPCIDCYADCADNEFFGLCPGHEEYHGVHDYDKVLEMPEFCPTSFSCGHGPGYENDDTQPPCAAVDRTCIQINECFRETDKCDPMWSDCDDTEGSYLCECKIFEEKWGTGRKDECWDCTVCEAGKRMLDECTATTDRTCRMTVYDGNYAMETLSGSTSQCLVHWKEAGKIFPERYSWGGRLGTPMGAEHGGYGSQSVGKYEMWGGGESGEDVKDIIPSPDVCAGGEEPICGVCNYGDLSPGENIVKGMEAAWTFMHLELDLYLILNGADGNGFRCLGFQTPQAPYPSLLTWHFTTVTEDEGSCMTIVNEGFANETLALVLPEQTCVEDAECTGRAGRDICERQSMEAGEWRTDGRGPEDMAGITKCDLQEDGTMRSSEKSREDCELVYFCGFETNEAGTGREKLLANGGTVWNVFPLACQGTPDRPAMVERQGATHIGNFCERRWTAEQYIIRSLVAGDFNEDGVVDYADYRCLYFPDTVGGIPELVPLEASPDGIWVGHGGDADVDGDGDKDCGISLLGFTSGEEMNAALKMHGSADLSLTQEKALIINKQAVIRLIRLPDF